MNNVYRVRMAFEFNIKAEDADLAVSEAKRFCQAMNVYSSRGERINASPYYQEVVKIEETVATPPTSTPEGDA